MGTDLRRSERREADCVVELAWKTVSGEKKFESCRAVNVSDTGVAVECPEKIPLLAHVIVRVSAFEIAALARCQRCQLYGASVPRWWARAGRWASSGRGTQGTERSQASQGLRCCPCRAHRGN